MAMQRHDNVVFSDLDPDNRDTIDAELLRGAVTEVCILNNHIGPTDKQVVVHMWTDKPSNASYSIPYLSAGETRATHLYTLAIRVVSFEIRWKIQGIGSPMWATTGKVYAAPGEFFPAFGVRWDAFDRYTVIIPD